MGWSLKRIGGNIKNAVVKGVKDTGKQVVRSTQDVAGVANNPLVLGALGAVTGGAAIPLIVGAASGGLKRGGNLKSVGTGALKGAVAGGAGSAIRSGVSGLLNGGKEAIASTVPSGGASITGGLKTVGSALMPRNKDGSIDYAGLLKTGVGLGAAYEGYSQGKKADAANAEAVRLAREGWDANAPLRQQSTAALMAGAQRPDYSSIYDDGNPYKKKRPLAVVGGY